MNDPQPHRYAFGEFELDARSRQLVRQDGSPVALTPKAFDTLLHLVRHAGVLVGKEELLAAVWPGRIVEENNLNQSVSAVRRALGERTGEQRYVLTEPGRGYRFVAEVCGLGAPAASVGASATAATALLTDNASFPVDGPEVATRSANRVHPRWPWMLAALGAVVVAAAMIRLLPVPTSDDRPALSTIAVLPFKPLLAKDRDEVLELGMADSLIAKLSNSRHLIVRPLNSVRRFDALDQDPIAAGRALDATAVLEGQIQKNAGHVRVIARLLSVPSGAALWTGTFDEDFVGVFGVQDSIADKVSTALRLKLDQGEQRAMKAHTTRDAQAYELYLNGRYHIAKVTPTEVHAGIDFFRRAIDRDPAYGLAYAALAEAYRRLPITSDEDPREAFPLARAAAQKALAIDDTIADAHGVLGWVAFWYDWDWPNAEKEFQRAIELNPNIPEPHLGYGTLLSNLGRNTEALREGARARTLDPLSPLVTTLDASFFAAAGQGPQARALIAKALDLDRDFWVAHLMLGGLALGAHNLPAARDSFTRARDASGGSVQAISLLGYTLAKSGDEAGAQSILKQLQDLSSTRYVPATSVATVYIGLGDVEHTFDWLKRAQTERDVRMTFLKVDHRWDSVRTDPRFVEIARSMQLE